MKIRLWNVFLAISITLMACCVVIAEELPPGEEEFERGRDLYYEEKYEEAIIEFKKGAEKDSVGCINFLGFCYLNGLGVEINPEIAVENFKKNADRNSSANAELGRLYTFGAQGVSQDIRLGDEYLEKAISMQDSSGYLYLAWAYQDGVGREKNFSKALEMYERASDLGEKRAEEMLGRAAIYAHDFLMGETKANRMRFDKNYKGERIYIGGIVGDIKDTGTGYTLQLFRSAYDAENESLNRLLSEDKVPPVFVECNFRASKENALPDLNRNDLIILEGLYKGSDDADIGAFTLWNCTLMAKPTYVKDPEIATKIINDLRTLKDAPLLFFADPEAWPTQDNVTD